MQRLGVAAIPEEITPVPEIVAVRSMGRLDPCEEPGS